MINKWKKISSEIVLDVPWMRIRKDQVKLTNGLVVNDFYLWEGRDIAMIVPILKNGNLILIRQYKHGIEEVTLEFPAGYVEEAETPAEAAERELVEETGYAAKTISEVGVLTGEPNKSTGKVYVYCAQGLMGGGQVKHDITEDLELEEISLGDAVKMITEGKIWASYTIASLFLYLQKFHENKKLNVLGGRPIRRE